jgi:transcriptional regulator with XRE-family HTH domain
MLANMKAALAAKRVRQLDLAMDLRISPSLLSDIIHGRRAADPALRARIAEALSADERWPFSAVTVIPSFQGSRLP